MPGISAALLIPPGWTLLTGGPHIGLPLLAAAMRREGLEAIVSDWNLELARRFGARITESCAREACALEDIESLNAAYFNSQEAINSALQSSTAAWELQLGYNDSEYDRSRPESVRQALGVPGPLDSALGRLSRELLEEKNPQLIGISITSPGQLLPALYAARALRACSFSGPIILGGNVVTRLGDKMALHWLFDWVDALVLWQGEIPLPAICRTSTSRNWGRIPNLIWRDGNEIRFNPEKQLSPPEFELPDFRGLNLSQYWGAPFLTAIGSRGCYYGRCTFCSIPYAWGNQGFLGNSKPEEVIRQFDLGVSLHGIRRFKFVDEALHPGLMSQIADILIDSGLKIEFEGYARLDRSWFIPGLLEKLARAGLRKLYLGLELADSPGRDLLNKTDNANCTDLLKALADQGILAHTFCMFGYPGTGVDEAIATIDFALRHETLIDTLDVFPFGYADHTEVPCTKIADDPEQQWSLEHKYLPASDGVLTMEEVSDLAAELESYLWKRKPRWLHPVCRLISPWTPNTAQGNSGSLCGNNS